MPTELGFAHRARLVAVLLAAGSAAAVRGADLYVATNGNDTTGGSWSNAYSGIQAAIDAATPGDTIYVAGQTFSLTNPVLWNKSGLTVLGGYAATNQAGPGPYDPDRWPTVITRGTASHRLLTLQAVSDATIERATLRGGYDAYYGAGIYAANVTNLAIRSCRVIGNLGEGVWGVHFYGAGLYALNTSGIVSNTVFIANWACGGGYRVGYGGALYVAGGQVTIRDCVLAGNIADGEYQGSGYGGAVFFASGTHSVRNVLAINNCAWFHAGYYAGDPWRWAPQQATSGAGFYIEAGASVTIENATIAGHSSDGLYNKSAGTTVRNSILVNNVTDVGGTAAPTLSNNCIRDGYGVGSGGNIAEDPLFERATFYLAPNSPCVDAGDRTAVAAGLDGCTTRIYGTADTGTVDLGYHYPAGSSFDLDLYVSPAGDNTNAGTTPGTALRSITRAVQLAGPRTRVHVATGLYDPAVETFPVTIREKVVQILGEGCDTTILNANGAGARTIQFIDSVGDNRLSGISIRGGLRSEDVGAGLLLRASTVFIDNSSLVSNRMNGAWGDYCYGGGLCGERSSGVIEDCRLEANVIRGDDNAFPYGGGGAIAFLDGYWLVHRSVFLGNVGQDGGAYTGNQSPVYGAALFGLRGRYDLRSLVIASNTVGTNAQASGSGIKAVYAPMTIVNGVLARNLRGAALDVGAGSMVYNSILWDNQGGDFTTNVAAATVHYCCATGLVSGVDGNITNNPRFIGAATNNYRTGYNGPGTSPCLNAGTNLAWMVDAQDLAGSKRLQSGRVDIGAYEAPAPGSVFVIR